MNLNTYFVAQMILMNIDRYQEEDQKYPKRIRAEAQTKSGVLLRRRIA